MHYNKRLPLACSKNLLMICYVNACFRLKFNSSVNEMEGILDGLIILVTQALFFAIGWVFFTTKLFQDYEVRNRLIQLIFSATFAMSCTLFELIIFEILDFLNRR